MGREPVKGTAFEGEISFADWQGLRAVHRGVIGKPFCEQAIAYINYWEMDSGDFAFATGLLPKNYSEIMSKKVQSMTPEKVVSLGMGFKLGATMAYDLLRAAKIAFSYDMEDGYLTYLIETKTGKPIAACNRFLAQHDQPRLGTKRKKAKPVSVPH